MDDRLTPEDEQLLDWLGRKMPLDTEVSDEFLARLKVHARAVEAEENRGWRPYWGLGLISGLGFVLTGPTTIVSLLLAIVGGLTYSSVARRMAIESA